MEKILRDLLVMGGAIFIFFGIFQLKYYLNRREAREFAEYVDYKNLESVVSLSERDVNSDGVADKILKLNDGGEVAYIRTVSGYQRARE